MLVTGLIAVLLIVAFAVIEAAGLVAVRGKAQTAADAAALAAAIATFDSSGRAPHLEAARFAQANGATLLSCQCRADRSPRPRVARVLVEIVHGTAFLGDVTARAGASAEFDPGERVIDPDEPGS